MTGKTKGRLLLGGVGFILLTMVSAAAGLIKAIVMITVSLVFTTMLVKGLGLIHKD